MSGDGSDILQSVEHTVRVRSMLVPGDRVVVAVSGGVDSMCLLDVLVRMAGPWRLDLVVAHLHHGLRGEEAEADLRLVREQAGLRGVPFVPGRVSPDACAAGAGTQARARALRYAFLRDVARPRGAGRIATGHHRDDQVETLLLQILRGSGGLKGIPPVRSGLYVRPLIETGREDIEAYAAWRGIPYREDPSNRKPVYLRNRIRHELIPWIRGAANPAFDRSLLRMADLLRDDEALLEEWAARGMADVLVSGGEEDEGVVEMDLGGLGALPRAVRRRVIRTAWWRVRPPFHERQLSWAHVEPVSQAVEGTGRSPHLRFPLPGGVWVFLEYNRVRVAARDLWERGSYLYRSRLPGPALSVPEADLVITSRRADVGSVDAEGRDGAGWTVYMDAAVCGREALVRSVRPGDRFQPVGLGGKKKLKDFFIDQKVARSRRARTAVLEVDGRIAWVVGMRLDERFRVPAGSRACLEVRATCTTFGSGERAGKRRRGGYGFV